MSKNIVIVIVIIVIALGLTLLVDASRKETQRIAEKYWEAGVRHIVALRGDAPSGVGAGGQLRFAEELVRFIRDLTGDHFTIDVAAYPEIHPESKSVAHDIRFFKAKVDAGVHAVCIDGVVNSFFQFTFCHPDRQIDGLGTL